LDATLVCPDIFPFSFVFSVRQANHKTLDSTALLIGEKAAMLVAEDLGYSGDALNMKVPNYHAPGELSSIASLRL
jgi:hypothetical protein